MSPDISTSQKIKSPRKKKVKQENLEIANEQSAELTAAANEELNTSDVATAPVFESETQSNDESAQHASSETNEEITVGSDDTEAKEVSENDLVAFAEQEGLIEEKEDSIDNEDVSDFDFESEENQNLMASIETILFMSDKPISLAKIRSFIDRGVNIKQYRKCMKALRSEFSKNFRGIDIVEVSGGFQLRTKPLISAVLRKMVKTQPIRISTTAMETLAIIAYKQPIVKDEIDKIRGVDSGYMIRSLLEKRLVKIIGRSELPGKPMLYATSHEFLELFNLRDLESLPPLHEIEAMVAASEVGEEETEEKAFENFSEIVDTQSTTLFEVGGLDEQVESLRTEIASISTTTDYIEDQKRKEKIKLKLDSRNLSDEDRLELTRQLNEIDAKYEPKTETVTESVSAEPITNEELVSETIPNAENFDKQYLELTEEKVHEAMNAIETIQSQNSEALMQAFETMVASQNVEANVVSNEASVETSEMNHENIAVAQEEHSLEQPLEKEPEGL